MSLSIEPTVLLDGLPIFPQSVSDWFIPTLSLFWVGCEHTLSME